jgi:hypothetical protein
MTPWSSVMAFATALSVPAAAMAQDLPRSINDPPRGPGTEQTSQYRSSAERVRPGWEAGAQIGGGIGVGIGIRAGYSLVPGVYAGGSLMHFFGPNVNTLTGTDRESQTIFGADIGYKFFPRPQVELRPFLFTGLGVFNRLNAANGIVDQSTDFTVSPSFLAAYHIGNLFITGETRLQVTPTPVHFALLGGLGVGL